MSFRSTTYGVLRYSVGRKFGELVKDTRCCLTWYGFVKGVVDVIQVLGEVGGLSYVSQEQARVHDSAEGNLQSNGKERNSTKTIQLMQHLMINPGRVLLSSQTNCKVLQGYYSCTKSLFFHGRRCLSVCTFMDDREKCPRSAYMASAPANFSPHLKT